MGKVIIEQDSAWKDIFDEYLYDFMELCLPTISKLIDWQKPIIPLDKELQRLIKPSDIGKNNHD